MPEEKGWNGGEGTWCVWIWDGRVGAWGIGVRFGEGVGGGSYESWWAGGESYGARAVAGVGLGEEVAHFE